jgi:hypothetical protein|tara:strand:+ start:682 stop:939 length:258 start_codon:yes stop_codon:yes gene_type:complete
LPVVAVVVFIMPLIPLVKVVVLGDLMQVLEMVVMVLEQMDLLHCKTLVLVVEEEVIQHQQEVQRVDKVVPVSSLSLTQPDKYLKT